MASVPPYTPIGFADSVLEAGAQVLVLPARYSDHAGKLLRQPAMGCARCCRSLGRGGRLSHDAVRAGGRTRRARHQRAQVLLPVGTRAHGRRQRTRQVPERRRRGVGAYDVHGRADEPADARHLVAALDKVLLPGTAARATERAMMKNAYVLSLAAVVLTGSGCFRTVYHGLEPPAYQPATQSVRRNREDNSSWQHFFV